ncbi:CARDB domain-containing protein [Pinibacter soli]|uniref:CARDB domain-containing protein n=1 Tax=Pinibacter soli TaxID=3044211 RepID=A0ABT6RDR6_9BACT|nr:CARDB domain-containing protein [Pinibacter soli]MDI3320680.1 CARDB domain-containing protein [Pinibacter soli]
MTKYFYAILLLVIAACSYAQDPAYPPAPSALQNIVAAEYFIDTDPGPGNATPTSVTAATDISNLAATINVNSLSNGLHRLYLRTRNASGFWSITAMKDFLYDANVVYAAPPAAAQNIVAAEYFIDTDPGHGGGTPITISAGLDLSNIPATINTATLSNGTHRLYIRSRNNEGRWSLTSVKEFIVNFDFTYAPAPLAAQNIVATEYFFDTDPGLGSGSAIAVAAGTEISNLAVATNTAGLSNGIHRLYIRSKNNEGFWSLTNVRDFIVNADFTYPVTPQTPQNIITVEYFIDTDPGVGSCQAISIAAGVDLNNINASVNTTGLSNGTHRLYIRSKNNEGRWSITNVKDFIINADYYYPVVPTPPLNIIAAEYFIDTDPGTGNGQSITIAAGTDLNNITASINTSSLASGDHNLFIRTKNQEGNWSITAWKKFAVGLLSLAPDSLNFSVVPVNTTITKDIVVTNASATNQTINSVDATVPFTTNITGTVTIAAGKTDTIRVSFTPTNAIAYSDTIVIHTSGDAFKVAVKGQGATQIPSWTIDPAAGHDFGAVATGAPSTFIFSIRNTGNITATLSNVVSSNTAFGVTFTPGTTIPVNSSITLPVTFTPSLISSFVGQLKIVSSTPGIDSVTTQLSGSGYVPGAAPSLSFISIAPFGGTRGVSAEAGQTGMYTYKIVYKSADNRPPATDFPKVGIDRNGDGDFDDAGEGMYTMNQDGASTDYVNGVTYTLTVEHPNFTNTLGYQFFATDDHGNSSNFGYKAGPIITYELLDLKIFANDISFSKNNPAVSEPFTVTANITNSSAYTATNVPIKFYRDTILIGSGTIPVVEKFSSATISKVFSFATDGFYPIKVWIDSSNTLGESNILNNYAIRPVTVGHVILPGGINITSAATVQSCPTAVLITGSAVYYGTAVPQGVAGGEVDIKIGTETFTTTTDANGNYSYLLQNVACGGTITYQVTVTDFTFTSNPTTVNVNVACPTKPCNIVPQPGVVMASTFSNAPCSKKVGTTGQVNVTVSYRARNLSNFWNAWDQILKDTVRVFHNGKLIETFWSVDGTTSPGEVKTFPIFITLDKSGPNEITAEQSYVYNEFFEIPGAFYKGVFEPMGGGGSVTMIAESTDPDLTIQNFQQTKFTSFTFADANIKCGDAGPHKVQLLDSISGGARVLLKEYIVSSLSGKTSTTLTFDDPAMLPGDHFFRIVTDVDKAVIEDNEDNNVFETRINVPKPDLIATSVKPTNTALSVGSQVKFTTIINNTGIATGSFKVQFTVNGVAVGNKVAVPGVAESGSVTVTSDAFTVTTNDYDCPVTVEVMADIDNNIVEATKTNNSKQIQLGSDISPNMLPSDVGSASNPVVLRASSIQDFHPLVRNIGNRDVTKVSVKFLLDNEEIGTDSIDVIKAGDAFGSFTTFKHAFTAAGLYEVKVIVDTANTICEINETNNEGSFFVKVVESNPDFEVLSQYISPSSLNPNPGQAITIVGTVKNAGLKITQPNVLRFMVDDIQLGADVVINALKPGQDTTVAATANYMSLIPGVKTMKLIADPSNIALEERENNNEATRVLIVGDAPDMARIHAGAITFNPSGFVAGDSVIISYAIKNNGAKDGSAWVRFLIKDANNSITAIDSVPFTLAAGASITVSRKMQFDANNGEVIAQIVNCYPMEFDALNNNDTLAYTTVAKMKSNLIVNTDVDMKMALPDQLPGWIGGKIVLGDYDLTIKGKIKNFDPEHFVITNGKGKLKFINSDQENIFPVGVDLFKSNFVKIKNEGTEDDFSVSVVPYVLFNGTSGDTVKTNVVNRTWFIEEETPGGSNATVEFFWKPADELPGFDRAQSRTAHFTTIWEMGNKGGAVADTLGNYSKWQDGYTSFSPFTITSGVGEALPLHLLEFAATEQGKNALLQWKTDQEVNTSHFVIQRSSDGRQFEDIGTVAASNSTGTHLYKFIDVEVLQNINYYRLKMVDINGAFTYSDIKQVKFETEFVMQVYPNPAQQFIRVKGIEANGTIQIISIEGKVMQQLTTTAINMQIDLSKLPRGIYVIQYKNKNQQQQQMIIKQ